MIAQRHMHLYGTTPEQLAQVAVAHRAWAGLTENAWFRDPIGVDDVLASPMVSCPLHRLDCCVVTDGGAAVIVTTRERAESSASDLCTSSAPPRATRTGTSPAWPT